MERISPLILEELNVKELKYESMESVAALEESGYVVVSEPTCNTAIDPSLSPELKAEGMVREIVHRLQIMRRSAGFDIADYIVTYYQGEAYVRQVMEDFADYIKQETLSRQLVEGVPQEGAFTESHKLGGYDILLGVRKATVC